jgi:hypothetical protein
MNGPAPLVDDARNEPEADGGESGIRTHGRVSPTHAFQAIALMTPAGELEHVNRPVLEYFGGRSTN